MPLLEILKKKQSSQGGDQTLEQSCGIQTFEDIQNLPGQGSEQPDLTPKSELTSGWIDTAIRGAGSWPT